MPGGMDAGFATGLHVILHESQVCIPSSYFFETWLS